MFSVAVLLAEPALRLTGVHLPEPAPAVRWVATSELADPTPYLEGGEVLLTTGLAMSGWHSEWEGYVERLIAASVAALGLGVGLTHLAAPSTLVAACRAYDLTLFTVPRDTAFVAVSRSVAEQLETQRAAAAARALDAQHTLTRAALDVDDPAPLVERLGELVRGAAVTLDREGRVLSGPHGPLATGLDLAELAAEVARMRGRGLRAAARSTAREGAVSVHPLGVRGRPEAWLAVLVPGPASAAPSGVVSTAVSLMSLTLEHRRERRSADRELRARALEVLLAGDVRSARVVLAATSSSPAPGGRRPWVLDERLRVLRVRGGSDAIDDAVALAEQRRLLARLDASVLTVAGPPRRASAAAEGLAALGLQVGVGRVVPVAEAAVSADTADHALALTGPAVPLRSWEEVTAGGVVGLLGGDRATSFAQAFLAPLVDDDLRITLDAFLRHHGSRGETAVDLGVHRNTVRNRIDQIETLLGASLDDPRTRVDAWVALHVERLAGRPPADPWPARDRGGRQTAYDGAG